MTFNFTFFGTEKVIPELIDLDGWCFWGIHETCKCMHVNPFRLTQARCECDNLNHSRNKVEISRLCTTYHVLCIKMFRLCTN